MLKFKALCAFVALAAASVSIAEELSETGEFLDGVAAIVNEGVVLKSQMAEQLETIRRNAAAQGMQLPPEDILGGLQALVGVVEMFGERRVHARRLPRLPCPRRSA